VYDNNAMLLRRNVWENDLLEAKLKNYTKSGHEIREWDAGKLGHYAGYHCSWCYNPEGIRTKLLSAQKHDKPRWGDYPEKTDVSYISGLIQKGGWFDGKKPFIKVTDTEQTFYAPQYIKDNRDRFRYLLERPGT
jgi:beta-1,4-mannosyl-glycoprotein beta-1,4-N-acetylglucosaminyltransferase